MSLPLEPEPDTREPRPAPGDRVRDEVDSATLIRGMILKLAITTLVLAAGTAVALASMTWNEPPEAADPDGAGAREPAAGR